MDSQGPELCSANDIILLPEIFVWNEFISNWKDKTRRCDKTIMPPARMTKNTPAPISDTRSEAGGGGQRGLGPTIGSLEQVGSEASLERCCVRFG